MNTTKQTSLFSAIAIGVGAIIGSGWLFAAYYSAKFAGPASIFSWIIGAAIALCLALLLAEIVTLYQQRGLVARLLTITHNRDYGFMVALSNWLCFVVFIPSEAEATTQYLSTMVPRLQPYIFAYHHLTVLGLLIVGLLTIIYGVINFWGIKSLAKTNNVITIIKLLVPLFAGITIMATTFHAHNFVAYRDTLAPYGIGKVFSAVTNSGIFYAFFGYSLIPIFAKELKDPQKNIPIALIASVVICLIIYLVLQVAFIGALPSAMVAKGWAHINFTSPLAQLAMMLDLNLLVVLLYADSALSPSGTGAIYAGSASRTLTGMAADRQMPRFFAVLHPLHNFSRRSMIFSLSISFVMVLFFKKWQTIMLLVTVFQLLSGVAIPIAFTKLRQTEAHRHRLFKMPFGSLVGFFIYLLLTFLLTQAGLKALAMALVLHMVFFVIYSVSAYGGDTGKIIRGFCSSWTMFLYLAVVALYGYLQQIDWLQRPTMLISFFVVATILYWLLLGQRDFQTKTPQLIKV